MSDSFAVRTDKFCKDYGEVHALVDVDLAIPTGSVCALIGRNGAGKTTAIHTLIGMIGHGVTVQPGRTSGAPSAGVAHVAYAAPDFGNAEWASQGTVRHVVERHDF